MLTPTQAKFIKPAPQSCGVGGLVKVVVPPLGEDVLPDLSG